MLLTAFERPSAAAIELNSWVVGLSLPVKTRDGGNDQEMTVDTTEATYYRRRVARSCRPGLRAGHWRVLWSTSPIQDTCVMETRCDEAYL